MEIGNQIKQHRATLNLSQEELAEQIYVTRQTLSNWENGKTYPDVNSLLRLSDVFGVTLDELVKGDIPKMKEQIKQTDIIEFKRASYILTVMYLVMVVSALPLWTYLKITGMVIWGIWTAASLLYAIHVEKLKKRHNIQTYKEIQAFMDGKRLDELETAEEKGKRPYQKILLTLGSALLGAICGFLFMALSFR
ncbi:MAG: helix-turn-helix transcriptional regulator [Oscillospiraceae bacterium]|nr:helix-turn-helix transcriptional regulator [Oscillospiraceae bacterium]